METSAQTLKLTQMSSFETNLTPEMNKLHSLQDQSSKMNA